MKYIIVTVIWIIVTWGLYILFSQYFQTKNFQAVVDVDETIKNTMQDSGKIQITDGVKHSVPLDEILSGGPVKDGIPPIDSPEFLSNAEIEFLNANDEGIGFTDEKNISYFLPFRILVWHEIVNMKVNYNGRTDFPLSVTYCPLCRTGVIYKGVVEGRDVTFGTSGKLWQSNLVMYDRQEKGEDESLWSQVLGQGIVGEKTGKKLEIFRSTITDYRTWKTVHTETKVLSTNTGNTRDYSTDPYGPSYYTGTDIYFPINFTDNKTHPKELVLGMEIDGSFLAYKKEGLNKVDDTFGFHFISITKNTDGGFAVLVDGNEHSYTEGFWFSWKSAHPSAILK